MNSKYYLPVLLVLMGLRPVYSQGFTSPAGVMISHAHDKGGMMFSYTYMDMTMKDNWSGSDKVSDEQVWNKYLFSPQSMHMGMHMLMGMYGVSDHLSVMMMTEYLSSSMTMALPPGTVLEHHHGDSTVNESGSTIHEHTTSGFGDVRLWAVYKLVGRENSSLILSAGLNIPTGKINIEAGEHAIFPGEQHPYMMQLGTGTLDFMPGLTYVVNRGNLTCSIQALSTIRPFYNSKGYHYGNDLTLNAWTSYMLTSFMSASVRLEGYTGTTISGSDPQIYAVVEPAADPQCYGGQRLSAYAGMNFYVHKSFLSNSKLVIEFGSPVYQNVNGIQQVASYCWNAGITKAF